MADQGAWFLVISRGTLRLPPEHPTQVEHRDWLVGLHRNGRVLFSGPTEDGTTGVYVLLADSIMDATEHAAQDPLHREGVRTPEVLAWHVRRAFRLAGPSIADVEGMASSIAAGG